MNYYKINSLRFLVIQISIVNNLLKILIDLIQEFANQGFKKITKNQDLKNQYFPGFSVKQLKLGLKWIAYEFRSFQIRFVVVGLGQVFQIKP